MFGELIDHVKVDMVATPADGVAATTDLDHTALDMSNYEGVLFVVPLGAITSGAVTSAVVQQSDSSGSGFASLSGATVTIADTDDNKAVVINVHKPQKRYVRLHVDRGTQNAVVGSITALRYGARKVPVTNDGASLQGTPVSLVSPAEA